MAQTPLQKFKHGDKNFPIVYEDSHVRVYLNPSREVFVESVPSGATMRIHDYPHRGGGLLFTTDARVEPVRVSNMIGWRVGPGCRPSSSL